MYLNDEAFKYINDVAVLVQLTDTNLQYSWDTPGTKILSLA